MHVYMQDVSLKEGEKIVRLGTIAQVRADTVTVSVERDESGEVLETRSVAFIPCVIHPVRQFASTLPEMQNKPNTSITELALLYC